MKKISIIIPLFLLLATGCDKDPVIVDKKIPTTGSVALSFSPKFNNMPMTMNQFGYINLAGEDISISSWGIIMSDFSLIKKDSSKLKIGDGYAYVNLADNKLSVNYDDLTPGEYIGISYNIGVDQVTNHADPSGWPATHPLNINYTGMHWGWAGGYIFHTLEGNFKKSGSTVSSGFSYHTATDGMLSSYRLFKNINIVAGSSTSVAIEAHADKFFLNDISFTAVNTNHSGSQESLSSMAVWVGNMKEVYKIGEVK
jgi:hypothetical protein